MNLRGLRLLCLNSVLLTVLGCTSTRERESKGEVNPEAIAREIHVGMTEGEVLDIIQAHRLPKRLADSAVPFGAGLGTVSGNKTNPAYRITRNYVIDVTYQLDGDVDRAVKSFSGRVIEPATVRWSPMRPGGF